MSENRKGDFFDSHCMCLRHTFAPVA